MTLTNSRLRPKVSIFGPQALKFNNETLQELRGHLRAAAYHQWAIDILATLPSLLEDFSKDTPIFRHVETRPLFKTLIDGLQHGDFSPSLFPMPNYLLSPLVVIAQIVQYSGFIKAAAPGLEDTAALPSAIAVNHEILGLCVGTLSAFAAASSRSVAELYHHGAVAVRLSALAGALVDSREAILSPEEKSVSFSAYFANGPLEKGFEEASKSSTEVGSSLACNLILALKS
jgi:hypothetical protein